jgi:glucose-1-phosphatase
VTDVVLFDLGGVLVRLGGVDEFGALIGQREESRIWSTWLACPWVRRFERGQCTPEEFGRGMVERYALELEPDDFLKRFTDWPKGLFGGAAELVRGLAPGIRRGCLSNTNSLHWGRQLDSPTLAGLFEHPFLSHQIGLVKPDPEIYEHVVAALGCAPGRILFLDDNQPNVDAARACGLEAERAVGPEAARAILAGRGLLRG